MNQNECIFLRFNSIAQSQISNESVESYLLLIDIFVKIAQIQDSILFNKERRNRGGRHSHKWRIFYMISFMTDYL